MRNRVRNRVVNSEQRLQEKLAKLSERQDKPLRISNEKTVAVKDVIILPKFVMDWLAFGPKHPIMDKFKELHFLADIDSLIRNLRQNNVPGEYLFEIEAAAEWNSKNIRETPLDRALAKVQKYLRDNALIAVPFDMGAGFCVMKKSRKTVLCRKTEKSFRLRTVQKT